jgi:hypothetical protein
MTGYDLRHLLASAAAPLAVELPLAAYVAVRRYLEDNYDQEWVAADTSGKRHRHPRQIGMRVIADAIVCAANAGKIAVYGGNPLAFNYAQWLSLIHSALGYAAHSWSRPTHVVVERATRGEEILTRDWDDLWDTQSS